MVPPDYRRLLKDHRRPDARIALGQLASTLALAGLAFAAALAAQRVSWALSLACTVPLAGLVVRLFILQHDCMHGSLFPSAWANVLVGYLLSPITLTPHHRWRKTHLLHHAQSSNLDRRAPDLDIYTMTVEEYRAAPARRRLLYRLFRHPAILFGVLPFFVFTVEQRFARGGGEVAPIERFSVGLTTVAGLGVLALGHATIGLPRFLLVWVPMVVMSSGAGVWLFYKQHQFRGGVWRRERDWSFVEAALVGASFLDLPRVLAWCTASIGYHHVHHLDPLIPNYRLAGCHAAHGFLHAATRFTLAAALRDGAVDLWDEARGEMVTFAELDAREEARA